jgi:hypothetical protein
VHPLVGNRERILHGVQLGTNQFILLYDSTPYAVKGHIALGMPCDARNPQAPLFHILVGRALIWLQPQWARQMRVSFTIRWHSCSAATLDFDLVVFSRFRGCL